MKMALIALNALLAVLLLFALAGHFYSTPLPETIKLPSTHAVPAEESARKVSGSAAIQEVEFSDDAIRSAVAANSLFSQATNNGNGSRRGATISLVGTVVAGEHSAAVILLSTSRGSGNNFPNRGFDGKPIPQPTDHSFKQYLRLGETNSAGYKLVSVEPNKAVLTRSGERLELVMAAPSQNAPAASEARNNQSASRRFTARDAMAMQMFQNMQMMRIMDRLARLQQQRTGSSLSGRRGGAQSSGTAGFSGGGAGGGFSGPGGFSGGGRGR